MTLTPGGGAPATVPPPEGYARAAAALRAYTPRRGVVLTEVPGPRRLAPFSLALSAEVLDGPDEAVGRLVLLHDPAGQDGWDGPTRLVAYIRASVEPELAADPMLPGVGWSWLEEALAARGAHAGRLGGTVTRTSSQGFGVQPRDDDGADTGELELRASWSPREDDLVPHLAAFCDLLASAAGLPPDGVTALRR